MENVVPSRLQRLRAADIIHMASLSVASVGQEYYRSGAVHSVFRRGMLLVGIVELPSRPQAVGISRASGDREESPLRSLPARSCPVPTDQVNDNTSSQTGPQRFPVEVEFVEAEFVPSWRSKCSCSSNTQGQGAVESGLIPAHSLLCTHGAALLYQWLAQPSLFQTQDASSAVEKEVVGVKMRASPILTAPFSMQAKSETVGVKPTAKNEENDVTTGGRKEAVEVEANLAPTDNLLTLFSQSSLSDLRAMAREYGLVVSGMPRQQLAEAIQAELKKPDVVRRIAATLEKSQRQLLAALILAGGAMSDDDLRGLFERFSLGQPSQLQHVLLILQGKALLFRTSLNASNVTQRPNHGLLNSALLDIGWYVPLEVRNALRVSVPVTPFDMTNVGVRGSNGTELLNLGQAQILHEAEPSGPLAMLLLVARLLDGYVPGDHETWYERNELKRSLETSKGKSGSSITSAPSLPATDGSVAMPSPEDLPPSSLLQKLQERIFCNEDVGTGLVPVQPDHIETGPTPAQSDRVGTGPTPAQSDRVGTGLAPVRSLPFLRFIIRVLSVTDLLYKGDEQSPTLRLRSGTAERLLGPDWVKILQTLFKLWLTETSYGDLYDLTEERIRLRCRAHVGQSMLHQPMLRFSELDAENSQARQYLVALLAQAPLNQWMNFSSFARFVYRLNPLFLQRRQMWGRAATSSAAPQWWLEQEEGRPLRPLQLNDWLRAELPYLKNMIAGPLHWWGACDIVTSADGNLLAFRLTPLSNWLFNAIGIGLAPAQPDHVAPARSDHAGTGLAPVRSLQLEHEDDYQPYVAALDVIDANLEQGPGQKGQDQALPLLLVSCSVQNWPVIQLLELFTEVAGVEQVQYPQTDRRHRKNLMPPSVPPDVDAYHGMAPTYQELLSSNLALAYRISAKAFGLALGYGMRPFLLLRLLRIAAEVKADSDTKKAQQFTQIATQLEQWLAGYGRVRLYTDVTLLETVDVAVMREVVATTSLEESIVQNIHPTLCIVKPHTIGHIVEELKQRGQSPLLHDEDL